MTSTKVKTATKGHARRKRIHNPVTGKYYQIRQRASSKGERGTIMGIWRPPKEKEKKNRSR